MFLDQLSNPEKFAFLNLAHYIARIDGEFRAKEADLIRIYCSEMGIEDTSFNEKNFDLDETLGRFMTSKSQKIMLLELMILIHTDDKYDLFEHKIIDKIAYILGIDDTRIELYGHWGKAISALYAQGQIFIGDQGIHAATTKQDDLYNVLSQGGEN